MLFTDVIRDKRDGGVLSDDEIQFFVDGLADESIPAEQPVDMVWSIVLNPLCTEAETIFSLMDARIGTDEGNPD